MNKRLTLICGHYGSGKTNVALNLAFALQKKHPKTALADLDIVNPYFRSKDSEQALKKAGIQLICSPYANTNLDIPALPQEIYTLVDDLSLHAVLDIGGDDRGAFVLGRIAERILQENNYEMLFVTNCYRPLTQTVSNTLEVFYEIENACKIPFTGIVNNSNLGEETTTRHILNSLPYASELSEKTGLPVRYTTVQQGLAESLKNKIENLFALQLQPKW